MSSFAIIDTRLSEKCKNSLQNAGFNLIEIPENEKYDKPVSAHPDIFVFIIDNKIFVSKEVYLLLKERLFDLRYDIIEIKNKSNDENVRYPYDCTLNFAVCGKSIIGNIRYLNEEVKDYVLNNGYEFIDTKQGYAKCNTCVISDTAIITEDISISKACIEHGIDVLLLNSKCVKLDGYDYGFIGGCSGLIKTKCNNNNKIVFCGDISLHPEYSKIKSFCDKHNTEILSLSDDRVYDYGSILFVGTSDT